MRRILCLGVDGGDYELVRDLIETNHLPNLGGLARQGTFGVLRSTLPAFTPAAWSSFLTGMNPAGHGIFGFSTNPNRTPGRIDSAATRAGTPLWRLLGASGIRSAFITVPLTYPAEPVDGIVVTGFGGPQFPEILPGPVANRVWAAHPDLKTVVAPTGWDGHSEELTQALIDHVREIADVCLMAMEVELELGLLCVDFMSSDIAGHLLWHKYDTTHPGHRPSQAGNEIVRVYQAIDEACGELVEQAEWLYGEPPTVLVFSDHGLRPAHWMFNANAWLAEAGYLRFGRSALRKAARRSSRRFAPSNEHLGPERRRWLRDHLPGSKRGAASAFPSVDFGATRAYCYGYGGQVYMAEKNGSRTDLGLRRELAQAFESIPHPRSGEPAFDVYWKEDVYNGPFMDRAPELLVLPRDERIHVGSSPRPMVPPFEVLDSLEGSQNWSGHHSVDGFLIAGGPGIRRAPLVEEPTVGQMAATLLALHGLDGHLELGPIETVIDDAALPPWRSVGANANLPTDGPVYTPEQEAQLVDHLRALGYE
jgi:predicted AlkP superfamily phosphohydrolase/phosphomutase